MLNMSKMYMSKIDGDTEQFNVCTVEKCGNILYNETGKCEQCIKNIRFTCCEVGCRYLDYDDFKCKECKHKMCKDCNTKSNSIDHVKSIEYIGMCTNCIWWSIT